jgi:hypothetical protein
VEHLAAANPGDLLLYDRGNQALWLFALHPVLGVEFRMRLPRASFSAADAFWEGAEPGAIVTVIPSPEQRRDFRPQGLPEVPLRVRSVRVRLRGGETEALASSNPDSMSRTRGRLKLTALPEIPPSAMS